MSLILDTDLHDTAFAVGETADLPQKLVIPLPLPLDILPLQGIACNDLTRKGWTVLYDC